MHFAVELAEFFIIYNDEAFQWYTLLIGCSQEVTSNYLSLITLRGVATQFLLEMESFKGPD